MRRFVTCIALALLASIPLAADAWPIASMQTGMLRFGDTTTPWEMPHHHAVTADPARTAAGTGPGAKESTTSAPAPAPAAAPGKSEICSCAKP